MKFLLAVIAAVALCAPAQAQAQKVYSQAELDALLAPVALQTDGVLSQVLMAATYPEDVAAAAAWSRANAHLRGDAAVRAADEQPWDPSVKSLLAFPELLARMDESPQWLRDLGEAFLGQQAQVMDTVQGLRRRAQANGQLVTQRGHRGVPARRSHRRAAAHPGRLRALLRSLHRLRSMVVGPVLPSGRTGGHGRPTRCSSRTGSSIAARLAPPSRPRDSPPGLRASPLSRSARPVAASAAGPPHTRSDVEAFRARARIAAQADRVATAAHRAAAVDAGGEWLLAPASRRRAGAPQTRPQHNSQPSRERVQTTPDGVSTAPLSRAASSAAMATTTSADATRAAVASTVAAASNAAAASAAVNAAIAAELDFPPPEESGS